MNHEYFDKQPKRDIDYVIGYAPNENGYAVHGVINGIKYGLVVDRNKPVTLKRCKEIIEKARELSGRNLTSIKICQSTFSKSPGNECSDWAEKCYFNKEFLYDEKTNSLTIWEDGHPVYANDDGVICKDQAALYDTLYD